MNARYMFLGVFVVCGAYVLLNGAYLLDDGFYGEFGGGGGQQARKSLGRL